MLFRKFLLGFLLPNLQKYIKYLACHKISTTTRFVFENTDWGNSGCDGRNESYHHNDGNISTIVDYMMKKELLKKLESKDISDLEKRFFIERENPKYLGDFFKHLTF